MGGDETRLLTLARLLDREAFEHVVVVVNPTDDERDARIGAMLDRYRSAGVEVVVLGEELLASPRAALGDAIRAASVLRRLTTVLRDRRIDVVDARLNSVRCSAWWLADSPASRSSSPPATRLPTGTRRPATPWASSRSPRWTLLSATRSQRSRITGAGG